MHTSFLSDDELASAHLEQTHDIAASVQEALAQPDGDGRVCVLPEGPQTVPYLSGAEAGKERRREIFGAVSDLQR